MRIAWALLGVLSVLTWVACPAGPGKEGDACDDDNPCRAGLECVDKKCEAKEKDKDAGATDAAGTDAAGTDAAGSDASGTDTGGRTDTGSRDLAPQPDAGPAGECDDRVALIPDPPMAGEDLEIQWIDDSGTERVSLHVRSAGSPSVSFLEYTNDPPTWHFKVTGHAAGTMTMTFTLSPSGEVYACRTSVQGTATDAGAADTATADTATADADEVDVGAADAGEADTGAADAGVADTATEDAPVEDA